VDIRDKVREFFKSVAMVIDDEITCTVDDVNELLRSIGSDELKRLWTVIGTIDFTVNNIYASNEEEANDYVMSELSAELGGDAELYDWAVDIKSTEQD
jgi:Zn-dependent oligopeptidase